MKKVLITGGAGFIGSNLISNIISKYDIICVDNLISSDLKNIEPFLNKDNFTFINEDIINLKEVNCDFIFNLACAASPVWYSKYHKETIRTCTEGVFNIISIAKKNNAKLFHASTSEVYGDPLISPQNEKYFGNVNSFGPRSCYDEGKRCAEAILFSHKDEIDFYIGRIFNTYGPNMQVDDGRVISNFISQAIKGESITIYGDGSQTRSFCYIDDMVRLLTKMIDSDIVFKEPFNIGNPNEFKINFAAEKIISIINSRSELKFFPLPIDDPLQRQPDITLVKSLFNWCPEIQFEEGIVKSLKYFKGKINV